MAKELVGATYLPPNEREAGSLSLQFTVGCPWNQCGFCPLYKNIITRDIKFQIKPIEKIKEEIRDWRKYLEHEGEIDKVKTAFIGDADSLIMRTDHLVEALEYLYEQFPKLERVTSYARNYTLWRKPLGELKRINEAGLDRLHVGLETGYVPLLEIVNKGVTLEQMIIAGKKAKEAGFELSEYVMLGLGGKEMTENHVKATTRGLNEINPDFVRFRTFLPKEPTPMYFEYLLGLRGRSSFKLLSPHEVLREARYIAQNLTITGSLLFDHDSNLIPFQYWRTEFKLPEMREELLKIIDETLKQDESKIRDDEWLQYLIDRLGV